jgi:type II secretory pathway component GspD/PulD (secretin)
VDQESRSVTMDVKVLQVVLSDEYVKGVDWAAIVSNYKNMKFSKKFDGDLAQNFSVGTVSNEDSQELQDSLDAVGIVQEVSRETDVVRNGGSTGVDVKSIDLVLKPDNDNGVQRVEQRETIGFDLGVSVIDDQRVSLSLVPQVSAYKERLWMDQFYTKSVTRDLSSLKDRSSAEVVLGETLVVGGLFKNVTVESTRSIIPLLGKIPLLGFAFRNQGKEVRKAEMILFITPRLDQHE